MIGAEIRAWLASSEGKSTQEARSAEERELALALQEDNDERLARPNDLPEGTTRARWAARCGCTCGAMLEVWDVHRVGGEDNGPFCEDGGYIKAQVRT